jgi:chemotaxis protein methyltransferase CheR
VEFLTHDWNDLLEAVERQKFLRWNLRGYKPDQVGRRLEGFMMRENYLSLAELARAVRDQPEVANRLKNYVTIHVSDFFRDGSYWTRLASLMAAFPPANGVRPKVWSAGCSWGAEPATFWLMARRLGQRWDIWATDTDGPTLEQARSLRFPAQSWNAALEPYRDLTRITGEDGWSLAPQAHEDIHFARHDLLAQQGFSDNFDLVLCRHVLIYFSSEARAHALHNLAGSLKEGGYFFIGATETLLDAQKFGLSAVAPSLFQKLAAKTQRAPDISSRLNLR